VIQVERADEVGFESADEVIADAGRGEIRHCGDSFLLRKMRV
jgi:hypothetical protein